MTIKGRIYDIVVKNDYVLQVIIRKKYYDKLEFVCLTAIGKWKKNIEQLGLKPKDKIKGNIKLKSNQFNDKWYSDIMLCECVRDEKVVAAPKVKQTEQGLIDLETGELI